MQKPGNGWWRPATGLFFSFLWQRLVETCYRVVFFISVAAKLVEACLSLGR